MPDSWRPHGLQHARFPCGSLFSLKPTSPELLGSVFKPTVYSGSLAFKHMLFLLLLLLSQNTPSLNLDCPFFIMSLKYDIPGHLFIAIYSPQCLLGLLSLKSYPESSMERDKMVK